MEYYSATELSKIKTEINTYLFTEVEKQIKRIKNTAQPNYIQLEKLVLLGMCQEIINPYQAVTKATDGIINNITEKNLQTIVEKVYIEFFNLNYPR